ncbi:hypothetical protein [Alkalihalobacillus sp. AL-G]|uniref:hypothetical protein n=1 Tax=Alkalihalobacillus sp. AL-G TaxID=2926399 RepID=UPI00272B52F9|nr:hypothetical protein [Alkalihalobacillus sp. AL-G]WLD94650.1 hypothetical protein MOJ78_07145 [Alkalihalobacillus sp. AL-G]
MDSNQPSFDGVMDQLNNAKLAVERAQEDQTGFTEAQQHVKLAEETLNRAEHDPLLNTEANKKQVQKAKDLLRLIEETNQATKR